jgi:hypothetical protein
MPLPALELSVQRYDEGNVTVLMFEADVAAAFAHCLPADLVKRIDELGASSTPTCYRRR